VVLAEPVGPVPGPVVPAQVRNVDIGTDPVECSRPLDLRFLEDDCSLEQWFQVSRFDSRAFPSIVSGEAGEEGRPQTAIPVTAPAPADVRAGHARWKALLAAGLAVAGCLAAGYSFAAVLRNPAVGAQLGEPLVAASLTNWLTVSYILCGLYAWRRRPESRFGILMVVAGFANFISTLSWTTHDFTFTLGQALDLVPPVLFMHVFLAFPTGYLHDSVERLVVGSAYVAAVVLQVIQMTFGGFGPNNILELSPNETAAAHSLRAALLTMSAFCLAGVVILLVRRWGAGRPLRRSNLVLVDAFALGLVMIACLFVSAAFDGPFVQEIRWATLAALGLAPLVFLVALLNARLARSAVSDLFVELRSQPAPADLRDAMSRALGDPGAELVYWLPEFETYANLDGQAVDLDVPEANRAVTPIDKDGAHVAALIHDASLDLEPELLDGVTAATAISLENGRLHAELQARLAELRGSRARIVQAGQRERQRLERDLHDGAQQRLVALSLELGLLGERLAGDTQSCLRLDHARTEVGKSLDELRDVARGIHPAVVSGHGLGVALEQLAARASVPVDLRVEIDDRLPESHEVAAYYVISESLTNVAKHAAAESARISVTREHDQLVLEIVDDGQGGADPERGSGLRGLADRVEALDGRLLVWTPRGGGTRVRAEIPCE
jgi:signal transduction histidine kinase